MDLYIKTLLKYFRKNRQKWAYYRNYYQNLRRFQFQNIVYLILPNKTLRMMGHSILSNNIKFIKI